MEKRNKGIEDLLRVVVGARVPSPDAEPWDYGWCVEEYRRSATATATGPDGIPVRLSPEGLQALEEAVALLIEREPVRRAWDAMELWGIVLTAVTTLPLTACSPDVIKQRLETVLAVGPTFVAFELANVAWSRLPHTIGDAVLGSASRAWITAVKEASRGRYVPSEARLIELTRGGGVLYGAWVMANAKRATDLAEQRFEETAALALLLEPDVALLGLHSLRGDSHRPGIRGLVVDREALGVGELAHKELAAHILISGPTREGVSTRWWGNSPFPLDRLLERPSRSENIAALLGSESNLARRLATAATWYAQAHWSRRTEDAVLALGVAFDALLGERSGLPGRVVADRFALLEPEPQRRAERAKRFGELYAARSAIAHGRRPRNINRDEFTRVMAAEVRWATRKILELTRTFDVRSDEAYRSLYEDLKWGTKQHTTNLPPP